MPQPATAPGVQSRPPRSLRSFALLPGRCQRHRPRRTPFPRENLTARPFARRSGRIPRRSPRALRRSRPGSRRRRRSACPAAREPLPSPGRQCPRPPRIAEGPAADRRCPSSPCQSEEHTSELQSRRDLVCRLLLEKKKKNKLRYPVRKKKKKKQNKGK